MSGATPTYRGYRLQALYILHRILSGTGDDVAFRPEGIEDLDILNGEGTLIEAVQVKSYESLCLSHLGSEKKQEPFFKRATSLLKSDDEIEISIKVVNFGGIGGEIERAWQHHSDLMHPDRKNVAKKLVEKHGLTDDEVSLVFDKVELVPVDENTIRDAVMGLIRDTAAGIDANSAFDLFMQWIYQLSEKQESVTKAEIIDKLNNIGRTLTQRTNFVVEWHTSIKPIGEQELAPTDSPEKLRTEFFAGISARYAHIEADLDFRRDDKLTAIAEGFRKHNVVIVHGASGQGKTALAYRYLHDYYPATWRYEIVLVENPTHALRITSALNAQAAALEVSIAVYVDVRPNDTNWAELIYQLTRHPYIKVLATVREEDFRRTSLPTYRLEYADVALQFNESEAKLIYDRAVESNRIVQAQFLNFEASWESFNGAGPLLEYVYLLTQTVTLQDRLQEQLVNISSEVEGKEVTDKWDVLRWVAVASAYEARVVYAGLRGMVAKPALFGQIIKQLEEEYLIRRSKDGQFIEGLHPIRSKILTDLMVQDDPAIWLETAREVLPVLVESDLQPFTLNALVDRPSADQTALLLHLVTYHPVTWTGNAGMFRALLWAGVRDYIEANRSLIDQVQDDVHKGWCQIVLDIDLANVLDETFPFDEILFERITPENRKRIETYRISQTSKSDVFEYAIKWLTSLNDALAAPTTHSDWIGLAEIMGWAGHLEIAQHIDGWIADEQLAELALEHDLRLVGDVSTALHECNPVRHKTWIDTHQEVLDARLADEYQILALERDYSGEEDGESRIRIHFIPSPVQSRLGIDPAFLGRKDGKEQLRTATIERVELVRYLYPTYERYASRGYGFRLGNTMALPFNETHKDMKVRYATPHWLIRINQFARGISEYPYRPNTWEEYATSLIETRRKIVDNLHDLQKGLIRYLGSSKGFNIIKKHLDTSEWDYAKGLLSELPKLPKSAVDEWGFSSESNRSSSLAPTEALGLLGMDPNDSTGLRNRYIPSAIAFQQYTPYLQAQRDYLGNLSRFFDQSIHVLVINSMVKRYHQNDPRQQAIRQKAEELGYRTNFDYLSTRNYWSAILNLDEYQHQFRQLLAPFVDEFKLSTLDREEREVVLNTWAYWYFFANYPHQAYANARHKILLKVEGEKLALDRLIDRVLDGIKSVKNGTWSVTRIETDLLWKESPALWIAMNVTDPTDYYRSTETLIENFRNAFGSRNVRSLIDYLLEQHYRYFVIIPMVRGKLINPICFAPCFATALFNNESPSESPLSLVPTELTREQLKDLGLRLWEGADFSLANQLGNAFSVVRILAFQLGEFNVLPEASVTEAGFNRLQTYLNEQAAILSKYLQQYLDAGKELLDRVNVLSEMEREERSALVECVEILIEISDVVMPQDDGVLQLSLPELHEYAEKLETIAAAGEALRLTWISDILKSQQN